MAVRKQNIDDDNTPEKVGTRFTVSQPHPEFTINPNILNEYGHTKYPKWVDHPTEKEVSFVTQSTGRDTSVTHRVEHPWPKRVLVQNEEEEKALLGKGKIADKPAGWPADKK